MPERIITPQWRQANSSTKYPFNEEASLITDTGRALLEGTFLDACLYVIGAQAGVYLASVIIDHQTVTFALGDPVNAALAVGTMTLVNPDNEIVFKDTYERPAGIIVSDSIRLSIFQSWGVGTHTFKAAEAEFAATVVVPVPANGVTGILLDDGTFLVGDVWFVGDDGVVLRPEDLTLPADQNGPARTIRTIRLDIVGDPLFRRRLCVPASMFDSPRFIERVRFSAPNQIFECVPDDHGNLVLTVNNASAIDTVLRLNVQQGGIIIEAVGTPLIE